jgi:hypothetical protein
VSVVGITECACREFDGYPMPEPGPPALWLGGSQRDIGRALSTLRAYKVGGRLYHGGVHVDGVHVAAILDDNGAPLYENDLRRQSRVLGRLHEPHELATLGWVS